VAWTQTATSEGETKWVVTATKAGYDPESPTEFTVKVVDCSWKIGLDYDDNYIDKKSNWVFQSSVELPDYEPFLADSSGNLSLLNGSSLTAQYKGNVYLSTQPYDCVTDPDLSGPYQIKFSGNFQREKLTIKLSALSVQLPAKVNIQCIDKQGVYKINPSRIPRCKSWI